MRRSSPLYVLTVGAMGTSLALWNLGWLMPAVWLGKPGLRGVLAHAAYVGFRPFCHQRPERTFHWKGRPFGVCQRCSGIYAGLGVGWCTGLLFPWPLRRMRVLGRWVATAWAVLFLEWLLGIVTTWDSPAARFLTGGIAGGVLSYALLSAFYHHLGPSPAASPETLNTSSS